MFKKIFDLYQRFIANSNLRKKNIYLRKQGVKIGEGTRILSSIGSLGSEPYLVEIGNNTLISGNVRFFTHDGAIKVLNGLKKFGDKKADLFGKIKIGDNCFIGNSSMIFRNVTIGNNCVVGAGAVVTKDVPDNSIVAGVPAKVISNVDDWYEKVKEEVHFTVGLSLEEKREYCRNNIV